MTGLCRRNRSVGHIEYFLHRDAIAPTVIRLSPEGNRSRTGAGGNGHGGFTRETGRRTVIIK